MSADYSPLGEWIIDEMSRRGMSYEAVSAAGGPPKSTVQNLTIQGRWIAPGPRTIQLLADAFSVHYDTVARLVALTKGLAVDSGPLTAPQQRMVDAVTDLTEEEQQLAADVVVRIAAAFGSARSGQVVRPPQWGGSRKKKAR